MNRLDQDLIEDLNVYILKVDIKDGVNLKQIYYVREDLPMFPQQICTKLKN